MTNLSQAETDVKNAAATAEKEWGVVSQWISDHPKLASWLIGASLYVAGTLIGPWSFKLLWGLL